MWAVEDRIASGTSCEEALRAFYAVSQALRACLDVLAASKSSDELQSSSVLDEVRIKILMLKRLSRQAYFRNKQVQDKVLDAKKEVAEKHLKLQNLLYEVMHLQKEVKKCLEFRSGDETIDLISLQDFLAAMTSEYKPEDRSAHQIQLDRLNFELKTRKELSQKHCEKIAERKKLATEITQLESSLDGLKPKLEAAIQATIPVQKALGRDYLFENDQIRASQKLPHSLYTLYAQAWAYAKLEQRLKLAVVIEGDVKEVPGYMKLLAAAAAASEPASRSPSPGDPTRDDRERSQSQDGDGVRDVKARRGDDGTEGAARRAGEGEEADMEIEEDKPAAVKRQKSAAAKVGKAEVEYPGAFPLTVLLRLESGTTKLVIRFWHYPSPARSGTPPVILCEGKLGLQTTRIRTVPTIMDGNLFLLSVFDGTDDCCMKENSAFRRGCLGKNEATRLQMGWVQKLCGLNSPGTESSAALLEHFSRFVDQLFAAMKRREQMALELGNLEENKLDFPPNVPFVLSKFDALSPEQAAARCLKVDPNFETFEESRSSGVWYFEAVLERIGSDDLEKIDTFVIAIHSTYPKVPPRFWCTSPKRGLEQRVVLERAMNYECWIQSPPAPRKSKATRWKFVNGISTALALAARQLHDLVSKRSKPQRNRIGPARLIVG